MCEYKSYNTLIKLHNVVLHYITLYTLYTLVLQPCNYNNLNIDKKKVLI